MTSERTSHQPTMRIYRPVAPFVDPFTTVRMSVYGTVRFTVFEGENAQFHRSSPFKRCSQRCRNHANSVTSTLTIVSTARVSGAQQRLSGLQPTFTYT